MILTSFLKGIYAQESSSIPFYVDTASHYTVSDDGWLTLNAPEVAATSDLLISDIDVHSLSEWNFTVKLDINPSQNNMMTFFLLANAELTEGLCVFIGYKNDNIVLAKKLEGGGVGSIAETEEDGLDKSSSVTNICLRRSSNCHSDSLYYEFYTDVSGEMKLIRAFTMLKEWVEKYDFMGISTKYTKTRAQDKFHIGNFSFSNNLNNDTTSSVTPDIDNDSIPIVTPDIDIDTIPTVTPDVDTDTIPTVTPDVDTDSIPTVTPDIDTDSIPIVTPDVDTDTIPSVTPDADVTISSHVGRGYVVISELMPKPIENGDLPNVEYIELFNASDSTINLNGWSVSTKSTTGFLPDYQLNPQCFITLCIKTKCDEFKDICDVISPSAWPSLTNESCRVTLKDNNGVVIDYADYDISVFGDSFKRNGGWSVERSDLFDLSGMSNIWVPSTDDRGGTPGAANSVVSSYPLSSPQMEFVTLHADGQTVSVYFDQAIDTALVSEYVNVSGVKMPFVISSVDSTTLKTLTLRLCEPLLSNTAYDFSMSTFSSLNGATNDDGSVFRIGIGSDDIMGNVIINEVMSSDTDKCDYIEIYNRGSQILDLSEICFCQIREGVVTSLSPISTMSLPLFVGEYAVVTKDKESFISKYSPKNPHLVYELTSFPNLPQEGTIALATKNGTLTDSLTYFDSMHSPLVSDLHDVALERISVEGDTNDPSNWTSAAEYYGFATPTQRNSQYRDITNNTTADIHIVSKTISPDGDGDNDMLVIQCNFGDGEWVATLKVFNSVGQLIAVPYNNTPLPVTSELYWHGASDDGSRLAPGTYIVYLKAWQTSGESKEFKESCTLFYPRK